MRRLVAYFCGNVTLIPFNTGEILRAKLARQQRKGKNMMGKEDLSIALKAIAKEAAKKAAKEAMKELKKKKKKWKRFCHN